MDTYAIVTEKIVSLLEQGIVPWRRPWASTGLPRNLVSKKPYRGINILSLWAAAERGYNTNLWATYKQWLALGANVRKAEKATLVVFWKF